MAPSINPPENKWISGLNIGIGLKINKIPVNRATDRIIDTGMCQVMIFFHNRYANPNKRAKALISPMDPPSNPRNISFIAGNESGLNLRFDKTVADVTASVVEPTLGVGHVVICAGKEINRKIRPAIAGLKILFPNPPNDIFTTPMEKSAPSAKIHTGRLDGTLNASNTPVIMAEPSKTEGSVFRMNLAMRYSNPTQNNTDRAVIIKASSRNTYIATRNAGISAISTPYMFFSILSPLCTCGEGETISLLFILPLNPRKGN